MIERKKKKCKGFNIDVEWPYKLDRNSIEPGPEATKLTVNWDIEVFKQEQVADVLIKVESMTLEFTYNGVNRFITIDKDITAKFQEFNSLIEIHPQQVFFYEKNSEVYF